MEGDIQASGLSRWMLKSAPDMGRTGNGWQVWRGEPGILDLSVTDQFCRRDATCDVIHDHHSAHRLLHLVRHPVPTTDRVAFLSLGHPRLPVLINLDYGCVCGGGGGTHPAEISNLLSEVDRPLGFMAKLGTVFKCSDPQLAFKPPPSHCASTP